MTAFLRARRPRRALALVSAAAGAVLAVAGCASFPGLGRDSRAAAADALFAASARVLADSATAIGRRMGAVPDSVAIHFGVDVYAGMLVIPELGSLPVGESKDPTPPDPERRERILERMGIARTPHDAFSRCRGVMVPVTDGKCPPAGTVSGFVGDPVIEADSARVPAGWVTSDGRAMVALMVRLRFARCSAAWCFVGKDAGTILE